MSAPRQSRIAKAFAEVAGLMRAPHRAFSLGNIVIAETVRTAFEQTQLYSYTRTRRPSPTVLHWLMRWLSEAQRDDGGFAAYYSLLAGYSKSYPEVTGYIIPTLYDFARGANDNGARISAGRAINWLLTLQMPDGSFPGGLHGADGQPSVFNTGQILQGLVRENIETGRSGILASARAAGDWLIANQQADGSWSGPGAYQERAHSYYSMVAWALAELSAQTNTEQYAIAAEKNLDWVLSHFRPKGWVDGINLQGHPTYLHFIAYVLQGVLECAVLRRRGDAVDAVANSAWGLLRKFETDKFLHGAYLPNFKPGLRFTCLTGNAQVSCVWLRLYELTGDIRYLNAALKMNEMLKNLVPSRGGRGIIGGVAGSYPIWGAYQPLRYISWGCKFLADALLLEQRLTRSFQANSSTLLQCAS